MLLFFIYSLFNFKLSSTVGGIAGVVVGGIVVVTIIVVAIVLCRRRRTIIVVGCYLTLNMLGNTEMVFFLNFRRQ